MQQFQNARLLIDGYNLVFQCGLEGRRRNVRTMELGRQRLFKELGSRIPATQSPHEIVIVFDATALPPTETEMVSIREGIRGGFTVVYALEFPDADSMIEAVIKAHAAPKQLQVVSSDHRLHKAALRRKARPIDSDVWFERWLEQPVVTGQSTAELRPGNPPSMAEDDPRDDPYQALKQVDWIAEFGLDDELD